MPPAIRIKEDDISRRFDPKLLHPGFSPFAKDLQDAIRSGAIKKAYCKACEKFLSDHPEINTDRHFGCHDVENGDVPNVDRLLMRIEVPPGQGIWMHLYLPGGLLHEEAMKQGY